MSEVTTLSVNTETPTTPAATRPEYIPEKFWKGSIEESAKVMAQSYGELERKQSGGTPEGTGTTPEVTPANAPTTPSTPELTPEQKATATAIEGALTTTAGSADALKATLEWARANASEDQKAAFDAALEAGNPALVNMVFGQIKQSYTEAMGEQGTRVTGEAAPVVTGSKPFASQQEIIAFVNSPEYKSGDRSVHAEYERRMKVTNW